MQIIVICCNENMSIISQALCFSPLVASQCISLILQGFSLLALGLSCSMHPGQEQPGQAARIGSVIGAFLVDG